jgi:LCP family protein required for cell wall assembly
LGKKRYTLYQIEGSPRRGWKRIVLWSAVALFVAVLAAAGGSYIWFQAQVSAANERVTPEIAAALDEKPVGATDSASGNGAEGTAGVSGQVDGSPGASGDSTDSTVLPSPSAMNILVLGSDTRGESTSSVGRSDTVMLVHIDPEQDYLSVLSLPRDLRVDIPGHGTGKLNTAFGYGGAPLAIRTVERLTGVDINHYLEIGFGAFEDIVDSLDGIYVDVDRRYFNDNATGEDRHTSRANCSMVSTRSTVRFRHDRNMDFGRMYRQQRFLNAVREQAMGWNLPSLPADLGSVQQCDHGSEANEILSSHIGAFVSTVIVSGRSLSSGRLRPSGSRLCGGHTDKLKKAVSSCRTQAIWVSRPTLLGLSTTTTEAADLTGLEIDVVGRAAWRGRPRRLTGCEVLVRPSARRATWGKHRKTSVVNIPPAC